MHLKIIPPLVFLTFAGIMYLLDYFLPVGEFEFFGRRILILVLFGLGFLVAVLAFIQFARANTTTNPRNFDKVSTLVTGGIYKLTRNPMYLGLMLFLLAWGLYLGNAFNAITAAAFVSYMNAYQIRPEEALLQERFGPAYAQYCKAVRRWF